jgi:hypothetical protein
MTMARSRKSGAPTLRSPSGGGVAASPPPVAPDAVEIRRVLGPLDDAQVCRVLETGADMVALQQAAAALAGDLPGHIGRPIEGPAARVYDLLVAETYEEPGRPARRAETEP